jgi:uncharacterized membrane protein
MADLTADTTDRLPSGELEWSTGSRLALASFMIVAGVVHFLAPRFYEPLIPRFLGSPRGWVLGSGVAEIAAGLLTALPRTHKLGAWLTVVVLVAVFPGNIKMAVDTGMPTSAAEWGPWLRLPLQIPMITWALRHTRTPTR